MNVKIMCTVTNKSVQNLLVKGVPVPDPVASMEDDRITVDICTHSQPMPSRSLIAVLHIRIHYADSVQSQALI